jgi:hypothetical protein
MYVGAQRDTQAEQEAESHRSPLHTPRTRTQYYSILVGHKPENAPAPVSGDVLGVFGSHKNAVHMYTVQSPRRAHPAVYAIVLPHTLFPLVFPSAILLKYIISFIYAYFKL